MLKKLGSNGSGSMLGEWFKVNAQWQCFISALVIMRDAAHEMWSEINGKWGLI